MITVTSDGIERHVFPTVDNRCQKSRKSLNRLCCGPNQFQDGYFKLFPPLLSCEVRAVVLYRFMVIICHGTSVLLCGVSLISAVELQFLPYVLRKISAFSCYGFRFIYRVSQEECARLREGVPYVKVYRYGQRSLKLWQLLHTYWLPNTY